MVSKRHVTIAGTIIATVSTVSGVVVTGMVLAATKDPVAAVAVAAPFTAITSGSVGGIFGVAVPTNP